MVCTVLKEEIDCVFMTRAGCTFNGGHCQPVVEVCEGCGHLVEVESDNFCRCSASPASKWSQGICNFATHVTREIQNGGHRKVNPLKESKRSAGGR